jgi:hypothetical protein
MISCTTSCNRQARTTSSVIPDLSAFVALCRQWFEVALNRYVKKSTSRLLGIGARRFTLPVRATKRFPTPRRSGRVSICASRSAIDGNFSGADPSCPATASFRRALMNSSSASAFASSLMRLTAVVPPRVAMNALRSISIFTPVARLGGPAVRSGCEVRL